MAHRKIDVDALDLDQFLDDEELAMLAPRQTEDEETGQPAAAIQANVTNVQLKAPASDQELQQALDARTAEVRSLLNRFVVFILCIH